MNHSFYEGRTKEKIKDLLEEGQRNQAFYRSGHRKSSVRAVLPGLFLIFIVLLGMLVLLIL